MKGDSIRLEPTPQKSLRDLLFEQGVEFPCGGIAQCGGCRIRLIAGEIPVSFAMREVLTEEEIAKGWRLGCLADGSGPVQLEIEQWSVPILEDRCQVPFEPVEGLGAVVDVGTTTLVAQLVDRNSGEVLGVETALNPQAVHGADLMSRIHQELDHPGIMRKLIRPAVGQMLTHLTGKNPLEEVLLVGNTAMHHFFCGLRIDGLTKVPFRSTTLQAQFFDPDQLGWNLPTRQSVSFLPCVGGFVGSDLLAAIIATGLHEETQIGALLDLGTNGEIAVGNRQGIRCASTAAGPAFEGGQLKMGMRASTGAIDQVAVVNDRIECHVIGGTRARGLCGSGLVDAVAAALQLEWIKPTGRLTSNSKAIPLADSVELVQADIRELQLAKAAVAAGLELLLDGRQLDSGRVFLAGAFGNYIHADSARRIGLLPEWASDPISAGNAALRGARMLLLAGTKRQAILNNVLEKLDHIELASHPQFHDTFVDSLLFPQNGD